MTRSIPLNNDDDICVDDVKLAESKGYNMEFLRNNSIVMIDDDNDDDGGDSKRVEGKTPRKNSSVNVDDGDDGDDGEKRTEKMTETDTIPYDKMITGTFTSTIYIKIITSDFRAFS